MEIPVISPAILKIIDEAVTTQNEVYTKTIDMLLEMRSKSMEQQVIISQTNTRI